MRDDFGREVSYLRLSVTDRCNLRCRYCMPAEGVCPRRHADILSFEEMREVVEAAAALGVTKVRLTGGEPLVRRGIVDLVGMVSSVPGIREVAMTTNATLLAPLAEDLRAAGLTRLNVSLDTLDPARYAEITRGGSLEAALAGLDAADAAGFRNTKVNAVLMGGVTDDVRPLALMARERPVSVRFIELMRMGECYGWPAERFVPASTVLDQLPELEPVASSEPAAPGGAGVAELFSAPGWPGTVGLIRPVSHRFCASCDRIRVTADGMLKPCLHSSAELPLRGLHGDDLVAAIAQGIAAKPARHHIGTTRGSDTPRDMNQIGG